ncbi:hypothetical protein PL9214640153 [Planktothrix tepida PCC 9214]|uniref:Transposase n=1 Tax=Planktothrix tepida PCC 9214 TaxID=671072 RepID=A0A1J1LQ61_9CYAN|nr:hypothetical protein PL9214640153 [Planktothrix tepida PCC 9214]
MKGVPVPMPLYRLSRSALKPGMNRFDNLIEKLVRYHPEHCMTLNNQFIILNRFQFPAA